MLLTVTAAGDAQKSAARLNGTALPRFLSIVVDSTTIQADVANPVIPAGNKWYENDGQVNPIVVAAYGTNSFRIEGSVPPTVSGTVRGIGLKTEDGVLYAYGRFAESQGGVEKPIGMNLRFELILTEENRPSIEFVYSPIDKDALVTEILSRAQTELNGTDGTDGNDGASAYELWLAAGNTGTLQDFFDSIGGGGSSVSFATLAEHLSAESELLATNPTGVQAMINSSIDESLAGLDIPLAEFSSGAKIIWMTAATHPTDGRYYIACHLNSGSVAFIWTVDFSSYSVASSLSGFLATESQVPKIHLLSDGVDLFYVSVDGTNKPVVCKITGGITDKITAATVGIAATNTPGQAGAAIIGDYIYMFTPNGTAGYPDIIEAYKLHKNGLASPVAYGSVSGLDSGFNTGEVLSAVAVSADKILLIGGKYSGGKAMYAYNTTTNTATSITMTPDSGSILTQFVFKRAGVAFVGGDLWAVASDQGGYATDKTLFMRVRATHDGLAEAVALPGVPTGNPAILTSVVASGNYLYVPIVTTYRLYICRFDTVAKSMSVRATVPLIGAASGVSLAFAGNIMRAIVSYGDEVRASQVWTRSV